jgi:hypothetical protein
MSRIGSEILIIFANDYTEVWQKSSGRAKSVSYVTPSKLLDACI